MTLKSLLIILLTFNCLSSDISLNYLKTFNRSISDLEIKNKIGSATLVFIPGILAESVIKESSQPLNLSSILGEYYKDILDWCVNKEIKHKLIILESEASVEINADTLEQKLNKISGDLIIISHSKGSLELLNILIKKTPLNARVKKWITLQSPFYGSTLANFFHDTIIFKQVSSLVLNFLGGSKAAISSLTPKERVSFMNENILKINEVFTELKTIQYVSYIEDSSGLDTFLEFSRDFIKRKSGRNDGMVEVEKAIVKSGDYIIEEGVDHLSTILDFKKIKSSSLLNTSTKNWSFNRLQFYKSLLFL